MTATVCGIEKCESLHIVKFNFDDEILTMMSLELNKEIKIGTKVKLSIKPSHIAIAKNFQGELSYSNKLNVIIENIDNGKLLSSIKLRFKNIFLESIITLNSSKRMNLKKGDRVIALVKASELSIL